MGKNWWVWLAVPAVVTTALLVAVAFFTTDGDEEASSGALVASTPTDTPDGRATTTARKPATDATTRTRARQATSSTRTAPAGATTTTSSPLTTLTLTAVTTTMPTAATTTTITLTTTTTTTTTTPTTAPGPTTTTRTSATPPARAKTTRTPATTRPRTTTTTRTTTATRATRTAVETTSARRVELAQVPDLRGLTRDEAVGELQRAGFRARVRRERSFQPDGTVFEQTPRPGKRLRQGKVVLVTVSFFKPRRPPPPPPAPPVSALPRVVGLDYSEAAARMELLGIVANSYPVRSNRPVTIVVGQTPAPRTRARRGSRVRLIVSVGKRRLPPARVPDTVGLKELTAHLRCRDERFTCRTFLVPARRPGEAGRVLRQLPQAGRIDRALTQMKLYVGR